MKLKIIYLAIFYLLNLVILKGQTNPEYESDPKPVICYPSPKASFPGGEDSLFVFLAENLKWPSPDFCGEGTVKIGFTVEKSGKISDIQVLKSLCTKCDEEAIRIVNLMPNWVPAMQFRKTVKSRIDFPINFRIE